MKPVLNHLKTYFTFSRSEQNGILVLLVLIFSVIAILFFYPRPNQEAETLDFEKFKAEIDSLFINNDTLEKKRSKFVEKPLPAANNKKINYVEINSCDSVMLTSLPGIGPVLASRIVKFRTLTGGFYHTGQLKEVYGFSLENFDRAKPYLKVNPDLIQKIDADTAGFRILSRHPYIGREKAWKIINIRKKKQVLPDDLMPAVFDSVQWMKVEPYLIFKKI